MQPSVEVTAKLFDFLFHSLLKISEKKGPPKYEFWNNLNNFTLGESRNTRHY